MIELQRKYRVKAFDRVIYSSQFRGILEKGLEEGQVGVPASLVGSLLVSNGSCMGACFHLQDADVAEPPPSPVTKDQGGLVPRAASSWGLGRLVR